MRHFLKEKNQKFQVFFKKVFCAFWALDIAPTLDVPVLFCSGKIQGSLYAKTNLAAYVHKTALNFCIILNERFQFRIFTYSDIRI